MYLRRDRSPRVVTGKWLLKNYKIATRLKNKTRTNPQIKNHNRNHEFRLIKPQTWHENPEYMYLNS